ncbi:MAG: c-type cytochrome [Campylobacteraceae bacterium]|jgi:cytochrome c553|nr:c-type cytochrome [Campylobacteraceae bacterium]
MFKKVVFSTVLLLCTVSLAEEEITIKATGDFAKELKELLEKHQGDNISGSVEIIDNSEPKSEAEQLKISPLEQAMQEEIKNGDDANSSKETYDKYFSDEKQKSGKGFFSSIFSSSGEQINASKGEISYNKKCASCHGANASKSSYPNARNLITLAKDEIIYQVKNYRRGDESTKGTGFIMHSQAIMTTDKEVKDIAEYIDSLKNQGGKP